eukprot:CAMPEP_0180544030 /NCGR_PEP_ID=MMETSP1036_2-20121128/69299_1 /TAXON_ID=632150 /ORGANISM="Azadinium spinosum, Strain 3D9" /LENGTH=44 /DNA_ID= /DNA_START= /DNA_END= /DNA_ORIENTATION=
MTCSSELPKAWCARALPICTCEELAQGGREDQAKPCLNLFDKGG